METVLITGVGKGIGQALTEKFLAEDFFVIGTYHDGQPNIQNPNFISFPLDLGCPPSVVEAARTIAATGKKPRILINNAGVLLDEEETHVVPEKLRSTLEINLIGTAAFTERLIPHLVPKAHIINVSSTAGSLELVGTSHFVGRYPCYKISKAALNMYTRTLALRLKPQDITVSAVHPGWTQTDMGGPEADIAPAEAAANIFKLAVSRPETGGFWFNGERLPW